MQGSEERRHEIERLVRLGRERAGPPSPRQMLTARTMEPGAWSVNAEEHIAYCDRHDLLYSHTYIGAQYMVMRRIALIKAAEVLRALDRQSDGLPAIEPLDARAAADRLRKRAFELHRTTPRGLHTEADKAVSFLNGCDGIPAPDETMHDDGRVTLTWNERGRSARMDIDVDGAMTMSLEPAVAGPFAMTFGSWRGGDEGLLATITDWVHHDGPAPYRTVRR